jgi:hypothetical protein
MFSLVATAWLVSIITTLGAQTRQSRLMGAVTDGSGAALPGVTVTVTLRNAKPQSLVTDGSGRYITPMVAPGIYNVTFDLSGFESKTVTNLPLEGGQTVVLDQQLGLAPLAETVEVVAGGARPPPPPPPPTITPVDRVTIASVCGPRQPPPYSLAVGRIVSHRDDPDRQLIGNGDALRIDAGEQHGVVRGQNYVVRRRFQIGERSLSRKMAAFGEQTAGLVQIVEADAASSVALVVYLCGEMYAGDTIEPFVTQPAYFTVVDGSPRFDDPARITIGEHGATAAAAGQMMVIDRGIMQQVQRGQRLTIFRQPPGPTGAPVTVGDAVIIAVRPDSATIWIDRATDAVMVGDLAALHR